MLVFNLRSEVIMVQITDIAKEGIREILDQNSGKYLRLFIQGMG
jgi:Fe-S cluster assembly iron-binding protein IscA